MGFAVYESTLGYYKSTPRLLKQDQRGEGQVKSTTAHPNRFLDQQQLVPISITGYGNQEAAGTRVRATPKPTSHLHFGKRSSSGFRLVKNMFKKNAFTGSLFLLDICYFFPGDVFAKRSLDQCVLCGKMTVDGPIQLGKLDIAHF